MTSFSVEAVLTGRAVPIRGEDLSAIGKTPVADPVDVDRLGLAGDQQADLRVHGGPDKAIHHYPRDHYAFWLSLNPDHPKLASAGGFGENISTTGLVESDVCIGDRFELGTAVVEICQGRQPCWKQGHVMDWPKLVALMVKHRRAGWYYRVIESGQISIGDTLTQIERPHPEWTVERVIGLLIAGEAEKDRAAAKALAGLEVLAQGWRAKAENFAAR